MTHWMRLGAARLGLVVAGIAAAAAIVAAVGSAVDPPGCATAAGTTTCTFAFTGAEQTFTVPAGVATIHVVAHGAAGGTSAFSSLSPAGKGAAVSGDLAVTPGPLYVEVGGDGGSFSPGGFNGGGASFYGGSGGGASDVRTVPRTETGSLASRLLVAAGGGGAGSNSFDCGQDGGGAGGDAGAPGSPGKNCGLDGGTPGGAGTNAVGGSAGAPGGAPGTSGVGGDGGFGIDSADQGPAGGGGGGGFFGGGGGGGEDDSANTCCQESGGSGGGGGGSNLVPPGGTAAVSAGPASVTISYSLDEGGLVDAPVLKGTGGTNGWFTSDVTVDWHWTDSAAAIVAAGCTQSSTSSGEGAAIQLASSCKDTAGHSASDTRTLMVDRTAPTISAAVTAPPNGQNGWYTHNVTVHFTCSDAISGIPAGNCPTDQVLSGEGPSVSSTAKTVVDAAGLASAPSNVVTVKIDKAFPSLAPVVTPSPVAQFGSATASPNASDAGSGLASAGCPQPLTSTPGVKSLTCTATDVAGNTTTVAVYYTVLAETFLSQKGSAVVTVGTPVSDTATLSGGLDPVGTITFRLYGPSVPSCLNGPAVFTAAVPVDGAGTYASPRYTPLLTGNYHWLAAYSGDGGNLGDTTGCGGTTGTVTVNARR